VYIYVSVCMCVFLCVCVCTLRLKALATMVDRAAVKLRNKHQEDERRECCCDGLVLSTPSHSLLSHFTPFYLPFTPVHPLPSDEMFVGQPLQRDSLPSSFRHFLTFLPYIPSPFTPLSLPSLRRDICRSATAAGQSYRGAGERAAREKVCACVCVIECAV
jgi:hypothetical protein